jgi:hypothetical protein
MLASAQPALHCAAVPTIAAAGFSDEGCRFGRQRATGSLLEQYGIPIKDARTGVVEADHSK